MASEYVDCLKSRVRRSVDQLVDELKLADPDDARTVCDLRLVDFTSDTGGLLRLTRCFVHGGKDELLWNTGWIVNEGCPACLRCSLQFGFLRWRHHCRACGAIICTNCSFFAPIPSLAKIGPQRVCSSCFKGQNVEVALVDNRGEGEELIANSPFQERPRPQHIARTTETSKTPSVCEVEATAPTPTASPQICVVPHPGFVVKTKRPTEEKVFINVYHHPSVIDLREEILLHILPPNPDQFVTPVVYLKPPSQDEDGATIYDVVVSSDYFVSVSTRIINSICIQKIIECINVTFGDGMLEDEYVRPRIKSGVKGTPITTPVSFQLNTVSVSSYCRISRRADNRSVASRSQHQILRFDGWQEYENEAHDNQSTMSDLTLQSNDAPALGRFLTKKRSGLFSRIPAKYGSNGHAMLKDEMLEHRERMNASATEIKDLLLQSTTQPGVLLGWQIMLNPVSQVIDGDPNFDKRIYVVSGMTKNNSFKTEYRISCLERDDMWVRLQRSENKHGFAFRPLRKVFELN